MKNPSKARKSNGSHAAYMAYRSSNVQKRATTVAALHRIAKASGLE